MQTLKLMNNNKIVYKLKISFTPTKKASVVEIRWVSSLMKRQQTKGALFGANFLKQTFDTANDFWHFKHPYHENEKTLNQ